MIADQLGSDYFYYNAKIPHAKIEDEAIELLTYNTKIVMIRLGALVPPKGPKQVAV